MALYALGTDGPNNEVRIWYETNNQGRVVRVIANNAYPYRVGFRIYDASGSYTLIIAAGAVQQTWSVPGNVSIDWDTMGTEFTNVVS